MPGSLPPKEGNLLQQNVQQEDESSSSVHGYSDYHSLISRFDQLQYERAKSVTLFCQEYKTLQSVGI